MNGNGFEAQADATLLLVVLLIASGLAVSLGRPATMEGADAGVRYAEDLRLALFRTTLGGLGYDDDGTHVAMPDGTTVETFLRIEVHYRGLGRPGLDFSDANARIADLVARLLRPGWSGAITGGAGGTVVRIPMEVAIPAARFESGWTYPPLGDGPAVRLAFAVWLSPR